MASESFDGDAPDGANLVPSLLCLEYPGKVENVDKMLDTLGGIDTIAKVAEEPNRRMELR